ncbi:DinB family protein [Nocardioides sp.]|uniref:DinB family protein n=1 Tax=Nocardioides sp. TaxID=35761 RepID=UPI0031FEF4F1
MTSTASEIERIDPPLAADEVATLVGYLDYHRQTLRLKTDGLSSEGLNAVHPPSTMTLGGMLKHLALVEDYWFSVIFLGNDDAEPWKSVDWDADRDWEWHTAVDDSPEHLRELFDRFVAASDRIVAGVSLDQLSVKPSRRTNEKFSLRWIIVHMIEEYARHNGHADLIRESIDGATGE